MVTPRAISDGEANVREFHRDHPVARLCFANFRPPPQPDYCGNNINQTKALRTHIAHAMKYFLTNFLATLSAYGLISFAYPSGSAAIPRICLMWAAPILGTLAALFVTRVSLLGCALVAEALAMYTVTGIYSIVYHEKRILDTLHYVTIAYFLPGAILALLFGIFAKAIITRRLPRNTPQ
jgi:hypothetical protein